MDWLDFVVGAVILLSGMGIGSRLRPRPPKPPEPLKPMCSCGHGYGTHESGAACHGEGWQETKWGGPPGYREPVEWKPIPCPCLRYDGPSPMVLGIEP